jgi:glycosyltransferase involved in cell wall biosynthesis
VEAARRLNQAGCLFAIKFIGDGPERPRLEQAVDISGVRHRVIFTGYLQGDELARSLSNVTALVMPSIWEETAGLSAMEHMIRGRVVVATDIGGLGEVVDGAGLKFPPGDVDALASCMKRVIDEPSLATVLGEKARQRAQNTFREELMIADHLDVYQNLVGQEQGPPRIGVNVPS